MQHIVNLAFDFDDEAVKKKAEYTVENELGKIIEHIVIDRVAPPITSGITGSKVRDWKNVENMVDKAIAVFIAENKDIIIDKAADKITKSVRSSKAWKEKMAAAMEEQE